MHTYQTLKPKVKTILNASEERLFQLALWSFLGSAWGLSLMWDIMRTPFEKLQQNAEQGRAKKAVFLMRRPVGQDYPAYVTLNSRVVVNTRSLTIVGIVSDVCLTHDGFWQNDVIHVSEIFAKGTGEQLLAHSYLADTLAVRRLYAVVFPSQKGRMLQFYEG